MAGEDDVDIAVSMAEAMASVREGLDPIREMVVGYRTQLEADGFSPTIAETMAAQLNMTLIQVLFAGMIRGD